MTPAGTEGSNPLGGLRQAGPPPKAKKQMKPEAKINEVIKRHLIVALIDRCDRNGKMTEA
ncbi:hypothetical protein KR200_008203, partial [Drosophila serrata]